VWRNKKMTGIDHFKEVYNNMKTINMKTLLKLFIIGVIISLFSACGKSIATHDEGVVINGVRWATRNVDLPGTFAKNPEDAGMLYQWNRLTAWTNRNEDITWDSSNPTGTEWYAENNPCPEGWRVPNTEELQSLNNAGSIWTNRNGVSGRLFGTAPNQIFLPATGWRLNSNGSLGGVGTNGGYWSSTQDDNSFAWKLWFNSNSMTITIDWRTFGKSIRCVAEN
jgi:uncharacterized protein (TIGR02145 family)